MSETQGKQRSIFDLLNREPRETGPRIPTAEEYRSYVGMGLTEQVEAKIKELLASRKVSNWQQAVDRIREDSN